MIQERFRVPWPLSFLFQGERDVPCYTASHHASHIVDLFSEGFSPQRMDSDSLRDVESHLYPQAQVPSFYVLNFSPASIDVVPLSASPVHSCPALSIWGDVSLFISFAKELLFPSLSFKSERPSLQWKNEPRTRHLRRSLETLDSRSLVTPRRDVST